MCMEDCDLRGILLGSFRVILRFSLLVFEKKNIVGTNKLKASSIP